jgi:hypothetical protein
VKRSGSVAESLRKRASLVRHLFRVRTKKGEGCTWLRGAQAQGRDTSRDWAQSSRQAGKQGKGRIHPRGEEIPRRAQVPRNCEDKLERSYLLYQVPLYYFLVAIFA